MSTEKTVDGLIILRSRHTVLELMERLRELFKTHGIKVFAHLDFSADAAAEGIQLRPTQMLIAGSPRAGTPLIEAAPSVAIDLPLKVLAWSEKGGTSVAYNDPDYLRRRHGFSAELGKNIAGLGALIAKAAGEGQ
ncbi:MAG TPA: DUF302 domain-containing protein [Steroidobacteraceae bacterium]|nr:DUF302 domain-containing protein [Steroidobacteraceae bacterium]